MYCVDHVVVIHPHDCDDQSEGVAEEGATRDSRQVVPALASSTMMVTMIAITPSLKASSRLVVISAMSS